MFRTASPLNFMLNGFFHQAIFEAHSSSEVACEVRPATLVPILTILVSCSSHVRLMLVSCLSHTRLMCVSSPSVLGSLSSRPWGDVVGRGRRHGACWWWWVMLAVPADDPEYPVALASALQSGVLTQQEHDDRVRAHRGDTGLAVVVPRRDKGGKMVANTKGLWQTVPGLGPYSTVAEANKARKLVEHGGNRGMWKVNKGCRQWYRCDFHKDCPVMLKAVGQPGNVLLKVLAGVAHSLEPQLYDRKNARLGIAAKEYIREEAARGQKPKEIMENIQHAMAQKPGAKKKADGIGIEGIVASQTSSHAVSRRSRLSFALVSRPSRHSFALFLPCLRRF